MLAISAATPSGDTSLHHFYIPTRVSKRRRLHPGGENGERWRVLKVTFPEEYAAHTRTNYSYFGEDGLLRRHLYRVDILGGAQGANYAYDYRTIERVKLPTRRRVLGYKGDLQKVPAPVLVSIDLSDIAFT